MVTGDLTAYGTESIHISHTQKVASDVGCVGRLYSGYVKCRLVRSARHHETQRSTCHLLHALRRTRICIIMTVLRLDLCIMHRCRDGCTLYLCIMVVIGRDLDVWKEYFSHTKDITNKEYATNLQQPFILKEVLTLVDKAENKEFH